MWKSGFFRIDYVLSKDFKSKALDNIKQINKICKIIEFSNNEISQTYTLMRDDLEFKDLEDTIQYVLAKNNKCDLIISNDKKFHSPEVELFTSSQFIKQYNLGVD